MNVIRLLIIGLLVLILYTSIHTTRTETQTPYYEQQIEAAMRMDAAMDAIKAERIARGWPIDESLDPLETGMIGNDFPRFFEPSITTTLGSIESKRTSTNPNFAALMVRYFNQLRLREGDAIAINFSGSFPALNIATLVAIDVLKLDATIATSIGASSFGANNPDFTAIDMEHHLYERGLIGHKSTWVSFGGENDQLAETDDDHFKSQLRSRLEGLGYQFIYENDLAENIQMRYRHYHDDVVQIKAFVNVGGNRVAMGEHLPAHPNGLTRRMSTSVVHGSGLIERFLRDDVPVIHLINTRDLARQYNMDVDSEQAYTIGESDVYVHIAYNQTATVLTLTATWCFIGFDRYHRYKKKGAHAL